jgi:exosortase E/protease (VPEID-CTERM system)
LPSIDDPPAPEKPVTDRVEGTRKTARNRYTRAVNSPPVVAATARFGLIARLIVLAAVLAAEALLGSYLIQAVPVDLLTGAPETVRHIQHWLFRFIIAYGASLVLLAYLRGAAFRAALGAADHAPIRARWAIVHVALLIPFLYLSAFLYAPAASFWVMALAWHAVAVAAVLALFAAFAPLAVWTDITRKTGGLPLFAILPAAAAVAAIHVSQMLWAPAAAITFRLVRLLLAPFQPALRSDPVSLTLTTDHFAVQIAEICSGLEGIGLMLAFCTAWLWFFRREYYFPRVLIVVPVGVLVIFFLNAVRIAALVLIGDAGYERVATVGFHSQAGWIAFNLAAFGVAILAHTNPWVSRVAAERKTRRTAETGAAVAAADGAAANPTAAYLMPLLGILAAGMIAHSLSDGFEVLYPLRLLVAVLVLWLYRKSYANIDFRFSWRGPLVGAGIFMLWWAFASYLRRPEGPPVTLEVLPPALKEGWIACRVIAALITVPIAEELAYRGYLMRRVTAQHFESVALTQTRWPALAVSAVAFGATHGSFWIPGIIAGLAYGAIAMRTGKLGEAIVAHGTTNALLAAGVLLFGRWQLW